MADRLSVLDASFLYAETPTTPMHVGAVSLFRRPQSGFDYERLAQLRKVAGALGGVASVVLAAARPPQGGPLNVPISTQRRFAVARTKLEDYRAVCRDHGGDVNDVVLAVVSGALRNWLLSRGEAVTDAMPDVDTLVALIEESLQELVSTGPR